MTKINKISLRSRKYQSGFFAAVCVLVLAFGVATTLGINSFGISNANADQAKAQSSSQKISDSQTPLASPDSLLTSYNGGDNSDQIWREGWVEKVPIYSNRTTPGHYEPTTVAVLQCDTCGTELTADTAAQHFADNPGHSGSHEVQVHTGSVYVEGSQESYISGYKSVWHEGYLE